MPSDYEYFSRDNEFRKLLRRSPDVDVIAAALELSRDAYPDLDFTPTWRWITQRADELRAEGANTESELDLLARLSDSLAIRHGLGGDAESYQRPESSYLCRVIETGRGIPISLSLLYVAVAHRLGLQVYGVAAPMHFLVGCETVMGRVFLDAFSGGRILPEDLAVPWLCGLTGLSPRKLTPLLQPARPRTIIIRMLNNLKRLHVEQLNWTAALRVQRRLTACAPGDYEQRRDLAVLCLKAGQLSESLDRLAGCLQSCPEDDKPRLKEYLDEARSWIAGWN